MIVLSLFFLSQLIGLLVTDHYRSESLPYNLRRPEIKEEDTTVFFLLSILVLTGAFLILSKYRFHKIIKYWFFIAQLACVSITLNALLPRTTPFKEMISLGCSLVLVLLNFKEFNVVLHNFVELLVYGGLVSLFTPLFNLASSAWLLIAVSVYDFVSVFYTKHMIKIARISKSVKFFPGIMVTYKGERSLLGGGDMAFPLIFSSAALIELGVIPSLMIVYGACLGLFLLLIISKKGRYYPALPFITLGAFAGALFSKLI